jgi:hypothetical protein
MATTDLFTTFYTRDTAGNTIVNLQYNGAAGSDLSFTVFERDPATPFSSRTLSGSVSGSSLFSFGVTKGSTYFVTASAGGNKVHWLVDPNRRRVGVSKKRTAEESGAAAAAAPAPAAAPVIEVAPAPAAPAAAAEAAPPAPKKTKASAKKEKAADKAE